MYATWSSSEQGRCATSSSWTSTPGREPAGEAAMFLSAAAPPWCSTTAAPGLGSTSPSDGAAPSRRAPRLSVGDVSPSLPLSSSSLYARAPTPALWRCRVPCFRSERCYGRR
jgi:hypothetical protein